MTRASSADADLRGEKTPRPRRLGDHLLSHQLVLLGLHRSARSFAMREPPGCSSVAVGPADPAEVAGNR
jgi:hypothetical protein